MNRTGSFFGLPPRWKCAFRIIPDCFSTDCIQIPDKKCAFPNTLRRLFRNAQASTRALIILAIGGAKKEGVLTASFKLRSKSGLRSISALLLLSEHLTIGLVCSRVHSLLEFPGFLTYVNSNKDIPCFFIK